MLLCYNKYNNFTWNQCRENGNVTRNQVGRNEVLKGCNYFDVTSNGSNSKSTHFNKSIKLDMQALRKRDPKKCYNIHSPSIKHISPTLRAFITSVLGILNSLVTSDMYVHMFHTQC